MTSPRTRRLMREYEVLRNRFARWPRITIAGTSGIPPESYTISYSCKGLYVDAEGEILERHVHVLAINLSLEYPRRAPQCRMLTPVFHPNFDDASICTSDFWAASESLDDLVIRIGRLITYQEYNIHSPLNGLAARWAAEHAARLPVDDCNMAPPAEESPSRLVSEPRPILRAPSEALPPTVSPWTGRIVIRSL
jgi:ubiquitin-protein ligase